MRQREIASPAGAEYRPLLAVAAWFNVDVGYAAGNRQNRTLARNDSRSIHSWYYT